jgi:hypothetical protein
VRPLHFHVCGTWLAGIDGVSLPRQLLHVTGLSFLTALWHSSLTARVPGQTGKGFHVLVLKIPLY